MVNEQWKNEEDLPAPGDEVGVAWGLDVVRGHVIEAYRGVRPQVVVEVDPGQISEEPATVTVPLGAVEPATNLHSRWAEGARYERAVEEAFRRVLGDPIPYIERNKVFDGFEVDVLVRLGVGRVVAVDVKVTPKLRPKMVDRSLAQLHRLAVRLNGVGLLVVLDRSAADLPPDRVPPRTGIVLWRSPSDDAQLARRLNSLLQTRW